VAADAIDLVDTDGVYRRMQYSFQGLETFGTAIAAETMRSPSRRSSSAAQRRPLPIDYAGPPGTSHYSPTGRSTTAIFGPRWSVARR